MAELNNPPDDGNYMRDYHHAAKTFTSQPGYPLAPYHSFLFHVLIEFNTGAITGGGGTIGESRQAERRAISVLVKSSDLPKFDFETETLNEYNRKRIVYKKIKYDPITLTFNDDVANTVRNLWIEYNQYYVADSNRQFEQVNGGTPYSPFPNDLAFGLDNNQTEPFIRKIEIYSMGNQTYSMMQLINPLVSSVNFSQHDYSLGSDTMSMTMQIEYETVLYQTGSTQNITAFGKDNVPFYDQNISDIKPADQNINEAEIKRAEPAVPISRTARQQNRNSTINNQQIDNRSGRVNGRNQVIFTENQYLDVLQSANESSNSREDITFPEATPIDQFDQFVTTSQQENTQQRLAINNSINSNGQNISVSNSDKIVSQERFTAQNKINPVFILEPKIPDDLTSAELALFKKTYPPIPSSDPRAKLPPYTITITR